VFVQESTPTSQEETLPGPVTEQNWKSDKQPGADGK